MTQLIFDEPQLIARLRAGEESAFEQLVRSTSGRLLAAARRLLRNEEDARDAVQNAFIRAFQSLSKFREESRISTWLHRILVNEALMKLRSRPRAEDESIDHLLPTFVADGHQTRDTVDWSETAEEALEREETAALIRRKIDELPDDYRTVIVMRDLEEMSNPEIADALGISTNLVKVRLHRARQALRTLLEREFGGTQ
ncbi:MAG TPA: sigma-70 family RNA polymerase sigma factor [Thermoanaerobaculia bacterium]|nr:sigma-70 family RNA polymerase sigma factor [Thermoanaerobaculia bacterium]